MIGALPGVDRLHRRLDGQLHVREREELVVHCQPVENRAWPPLAAGGRRRLIETLSDRQGNDIAVGRPSPRNVET
jgi:hypothetical protein